MDTTPSPDLSIIIVSWNVREHLRANLARLFALHTAHPFEVFVVDNGSHDGTAAMVRTVFPQVHLITNDWDAGFAGPNNQALRLARGEVCILLNPDMLVEEGALDATYETLTRDRTIGVLGGRLLHADGTPIIGSVRRFPDVWSQLAIVCKLGHCFPHLLDQYLWKDFNFSTSQDVDQVRGSFFAFRRELLSSIGPLDAGYHLWFEEVDYCRRVRAAGLRVRYCAGATARDYVGKGFSQMRHLEKQRIFTASMLRYFRKWHPLWQWALLALARPIGLTAAAGADAWDWMRASIQNTEYRIPNTRTVNDPAHSPFTIHHSPFTAALQLSCYNGSRYLPYLFRSLEQQTDRDWHLHVLDNASRPEDAKAIHMAVERARSNGLPITLHRVNENIGFAGAHNLLFKKHRADVVQLLNDDAILEPTYLAACRQFLTQHPECAAVSGVILRWDFDRREDRDGGRTTIIDTLGLAPLWTGAVVDIGAADEGVKHSVFDALNGGPREVWGVSGCLPMYRTSAIARASESGELFDGTYRSYKEDVDLAYRLQALGMSAVILPTARAYHRRSVGVGITRPRSAEAVYHSYRNHLWLLLAHMDARSLVGSYIGVIPYECAKALYWCVRHPKLFVQTMRETIAAWPTLMRKRAFVRILRHARRPREAFLTPDVDLAVVMVSHNDLNDACLSSLAAARAACPELRIAIIVADNGSTAYDANVVVANHFPDAMVLLRGGDHGFGRSCNRGAREVLARHYLFLNPDTVLTEPTILRTLAAYLDAHSGVGIAAPKIVYPDGRLQETCRRFPAWFMPFIQRTSLRDSAFGKRYTAQFLMADDDHAHERPVDWVQGSALCIRGDLWHAIGGFDERYLMYFEDIDLCRSVWHAGYQVRFFPSVVLVHAHGRQSARIRNILVNIWKTKETRWHLQSWTKYQLKWRWQSLPTRQHC